MTPEEVYKVFGDEFPNDLVEIHWSFTYGCVRGRSVPSIMVSVGQPNKWVHIFSSERKPATLEEMVADAKKQIAFWKELGEVKYVVERPTRPIIQLEFEAAQTDSGFETFLRTLLEEQLGVHKVNVERVNRYLGHSRQKMYLLLEGIGCSPEKIEQLKALDL